jgi:hypothetical protein
MATQSVILGASNCTRRVFENPNVHNISVSGTTLDQVQKLLDKSDSQVDSENVDSVVLSLGTNENTICSCIILICYFTNFRGFVVSIHISFPSLVDVMHIDPI